MTTFSRRALGLIVVSLISVVGLTAWYGRFVWEDSGSFAFLMFGVPLACTALALVAERAGRTRLASGVVAALGLVSVAWSLITGLGIGGAFLLPSCLLLVAALISWVDRQRRGTATPRRT
ncbi:hypothetical protein [Blastococcus sp. SYSU DS1024]